MKNRHYMIALALSSALAWGGGTVTGGQVPLDSSVRSWSIWRVVERVQESDAGIQRSCASYISAYGMSAFIRRRVPALVVTCINSIQPLPKGKPGPLPSHMGHLSRWQTTVLDRKRWAPLQGDYELALEEWAAVAALCEAQGMKDAGDLTAAYLASLVSVKARSDFRPVTLGLAAVPRVAKAHGTLVPQKLLRTIGNTPLGDRLRNPLPNAVACGRILAADTVSSTHARATHLLALADAVVAARDQLNRGMDYRPKVDLAPLQGELRGTVGGLEKAVSRILRGEGTGLGPRPTQSQHAAGVSRGTARSFPGPSQLAQSLLACPHTAEIAKRVGVGRLVAPVSRATSSEKSTTRYNALFQTVTAAEFADNLADMGFSSSLKAFTKLEEETCRALGDEVRGMSVYAKANTLDIMNAEGFLAALADLEKAVTQSMGSTQALFRNLKLPDSRDLSTPEWLRATVEARLALGTEGAKLRIWADQAKMQSMVNQEAAESTPRRR
jgi:hypothetical protein